MSIEKQPPAGTVSLTSGERARLAKMVEKERGNLDSKLLWVCTVGKKCSAEADLKSLNELAHKLKYAAFPIMAGLLT